MVGYVYFSESLIINGKIDIVDYIEIDDNSKKIVGRSNEGNSEQITFDGGSNYIILNEDTINKNIGNSIVLDGLTDQRSYFLKGKDEWYKEQIKSANDTISSQTELVNSLIEMVITTTLPTT